jgi:hypothetical protein
MFFLLPLCLNFIHTVAATSISFISGICVSTIFCSFETHFTTEMLFSGWFAKDPDILRRVGHILLQAPFVMQRSPRQIIIADDCFQQLNVPLDRSSQVVIKATEKLFGSMFFCCVLLL